MARIFISYARDDGLEVATELANRLRAADHEVFLDMHSIRAGTRWRVELDRRIKGSDLIVVLVTEGSNNSDYVYEEVVKADKHGKIIVPVRVNNTPLPVHLRGTWQAVNLEDDDVDGVLLELERTLRLSRPKLFSRGCIFSVIGILIAAVLFAAFLVIPALNDDDDKETTTPEPESIAQLTEEVAPPTATDAPTDTPQDTDRILLIATSTPTDTSVQTTIPTETSVPTSTLTETPPPTATQVPTKTNTPTDTPVPTSTPVFFSVGSLNKDWTPVVQQFDSVTMVLVPAGCFEMGSDFTGNDDEKPAHKVCFQEPFWIDRYEVTNGQYGSSRSFSGDYLPRENVTWTDAKEFCESRGARLPTEAEWEYAARGPEGWVYPWGNGFIAENAIYKRNADSQTAIVFRRFEGASWVGALHMSGNVSEWISDWYAPYQQAEQENPTGPDNGIYHVMRGGSWADLDLRATIRYKTTPGISSMFIGFRCARDND